MLWFDLVKNCFKVWLIYSPVKISVEKSALISLTMLSDKWVAVPLHVLVWTILQSILDSLCCLETIGYTLLPHITTHGCIIITPTVTTLRTNSSVCDHQHLGTVFQCLGFFVFVCTYIIQRFTTEYIAVLERHCQLICILINCEVVWRWGDILIQ